LKFKRIESLGESDEQSDKVWQHLENVGRSLMQYVSDSNEGEKKHEPLQTLSTGQDISGKTVVFTGFRDKNLENNIINSGGKVTTSVSKKTSFVVVGGKKGTGSAKETKAAELGLPIYSLDEFKKIYNIRSEYE